MHICSGSRHGLKMLTQNNFVSHSDLRNKYVL